MKFDDILETLESDTKILDFKFIKNQIPMYFIIRYELVQWLIDKEFNLSSSFIKPKNKPIKEILKYIYHTLKLNLYLAPRKDIYIFSSGIVNILENGKYSNRLYDKFYKLFKKDTQIIEGSVLMSYLLPKKEIIYFRDLIDVFNILCSKLIKTNKINLRKIDNFIIYLKEKNLFNTDDIIFEQMRRTLINSSKKMNISFWMYRQFLKIKKPKLIIVEDAHYLVHIELIKEAKSLGIKTAEYQHGYIGLSHRSYNYHKNIFNIVKDYLPEYFLTHGKYWGEIIRTPSKIINIGLANLSIKINEININIDKKQTILFISSGSKFNEINELIKNSLFYLKNLGYDIFLRPHPSELPALKERYESIIDLGVKIDTSNLYESLQQTEIVIGMEVSTVLYEAICFTDKVYMMNTKYTEYYEPKSIFITYNDSAELINKISNSSKLEFGSNYIWDSNWKENYINFIEKTIGLNHDNNN